MSATSRRQKRETNRVASATKQPTNAGPSDNELRAELARALTMAASIRQQLLSSERDRDASIHAAVESERRLWLDRLQAASTVTATKMREECDRMREDFAQRLAQYEKSMSTDRLLQRCRRQQKQMELMEKTCIIQEVNLAIMRSECMITKRKAAEAEKRASGKDDVNSSAEVASLRSQLDELQSAYDTTHDQLGSHIARCEELEKTMQQTMKSATIAVSGGSNSANGESQQPMPRQDENEEQTAQIEKLKRDVRRARTVAERSYRALVNGWKDQHDAWMQQRKLLLNVIHMRDASLDEADEVTLKLLSENAILIKQLESLGVMQPTGSSVARKEAMRRIVEQQRMSPSTCQRFGCEPFDQQRLPTIDAPFLPDDVLSFFASLRPLSSSSPRSRPTSSSVSGPGRSIWTPLPPTPSSGGKRSGSVSARWSARRSRNRNRDDDGESESNMSTIGENRDDDEGDRDGLLLSSIAVSPITPTSPLKHPSIRPRMHLILNREEPSSTDVSRRRGHIRSFSVPPARPLPMPLSPPTSMLPANPSRGIHRLSPSSSRRRFERTVETETEADADDQAPFVDVSQPVSAIDHDPNMPSARPIPSSLIPIDPLHPARISKSKSKSNSKPNHPIDLSIGSIIGMSQEWKQYKDYRGRTILTNAHDHSYLSSARRRASPRIQLQPPPPSTTNGSQSARQVHHRPHRPVQTQHMNEEKSEEASSRLAPDQQNGYEDSDAATRPVSADIDSQASSAVHLPSRPPIPKLHLVNAELNLPPPVPPPEILHTNTASQIATTRWIQQQRSALLMGNAARVLQTSLQQPDHPLTQSARERERSPSRQPHPPLSVRTLHDQLRPNLPSQPSSKSGLSAMGERLVQQAIEATMPSQNKSFTHPTLTKKSSYSGKVKIQDNADASEVTQRAEPMRMRDHSDSNRGSPPSGWNAPDSSPSPSPSLSPSADDGNGNNGTGSNSNSILPSTRVGAVDLIDRALRWRAAAATAHDKHNHNHSHKPYGMT